MERRAFIMAAVGAAAAGALLPLTASAQTSGTERRGERRDTRQGSRDEKRECKAGDEQTRPECRQDKRDTKQEGRHDEGGEGQSKPEEKPEGG